MLELRDIYKSFGDVEVLKGYFKAYTVREDSWSRPKVAGLETARYVADYEDDGTPMVEYRTYTVGHGMVYWFVFRIAKDEFDANRADFDAMVKGFKVSPPPASEPAEK